MEGQPPKKEVVPWVLGICFFFPHLHPQVQSTTSTRRIFLVDEEWGDLSVQSYHAAMQHGMENLCGNWLDTTEFLEKTSLFFQFWDQRFFSRQQKIKLYMKLNEGRERTQGYVYIYIPFPGRLLILMIPAFLHRILLEGVRFEAIWMINFPTTWGAKEPQTLPNHRVVI